MKELTVITLLLICISCGNTDQDQQSGTNTADISIPVEKKTIKSELDLKSDFVKFEPKEIDVASTDDSIWYHIVYDFDSDGLMTVAQPTHESRDGVRFQMMDEVEDGSFLVKSESSPGYDSPQLFPTFFKNDQGQIIILANTGHQDSWGLKVYSLINGIFTDVGFIDMAVIEKRSFPDEDGKMENFGNISKYITIKGGKKGLSFLPSGNKLILFDNEKGEMEINFSEDEYHYVYNGKKFKLKRK